MKHGGSGLMPNTCDFLLRCYFQHSWHYKNPFCWWAAFSKINSSLGQSSGPDCPVDRVCRVIDLVLTRSSEAPGGRVEGRPEARCQCLWEICFCGRFIMIINVEFFISVRYSKLLVKLLYVSLLYRSFRTDIAALNENKTLLNGSYGNQMSQQ